MAAAWPEYHHLSPDLQRFACRLIGGEIRPSNESTDVRFFAPADIDRLNAHPSIRLRIDDYLKGECAAFIR